VTDSLTAKELVSGPLIALKNSAIDVLVEKDITLEGAIRVD
jgi:hypothetical protein